MQKYDIHVCLVSAQAAPNLFPMADKNFKPKEVILLVSNVMEKNAENLAKVLQSYNIKVQTEKLSDVFSFEKMENEIINILSRYEDKNIALNVTGGTKLMAIAAQNAFSMAEKPIFYIDSDENRIVSITRDANKNHIPDLEMNAEVKIDKYLEAYGNKVLDEQKPSNDHQWIDIAEEFILRQDFYKNCIPTLNWHFANAEKNKLKSEYNKYETSYETDQFFKTLDNIGIINFNSKEIDFVNNERHRFLGGGWLEDYTYLLLKDIKVITDIRCNLNVANSKYIPTEKSTSKNNLGNQNEFDIAFLAKNKLHIIECKTQLMGKQGGLKADDILYKLETLKDYGGLMTKKCLVTYFEVPPAVQNRAKSLNIKIIQSKDLLRLKSIIQDWIAR